MQTIRKQDYGALGVVLLIDGLLMALLISGTYVTLTSLLQSPQEIVGRVFSLLSLLVLVASILFCAATFFWIIKRRYRKAATFQRLLLMSLGSQCLVAIGSLLQSAQGGVGDIFAAVGKIGAITLILLTSIVTIPWLILRNLASRNGV